MRTWLFTNTTYGTWLPGSPRGSVTSVRERRPNEQHGPARIEHDRPGDPWEPSLPGLYHSAQRQMKGPPIYLALPHAELLIEQLLQTAQYRGWTLRAASIMPNHLHLVTSVDGDPNPDKMLADFKAYGSRVLNRQFGKPPSDTWWTTKGSTRKLSTPKAVAAAINYVLYKQAGALVIWSQELGRIK